MVPAFQNRTFFWRNAVALANSWRGRRQAKDGFVTSPRWVRKTPIQKFGGLPKVTNLHWVARWLDLPSFLGSLPPGAAAGLVTARFNSHHGRMSLSRRVRPLHPSMRQLPPTKRPARFDETYTLLSDQGALLTPGYNLHLVGNSEWTTSQIRRSGLAKYAKSIRTIHLGLDPEQYRPVDKNIARRALGIPHDRFVIGFACSDFSDERKGALLLVEAVRALPEPAVLLTFGAGRWPSSSVTEMLHLGVLQSSRLQNLFYSAVDVFVTPSRAETFGNTAMEAMACETPVVAYAAGGLTDVVEHGKTGLLEPEIGSVSGLTRMLHWMSQHPNERQTMGVAARRRVIDHFTDVAMAQRYSKLYEELLAAS